MMFKNENDIMSQHILLIQGVPPLGRAPTAAERSNPDHLHLHGAGEVVGKAAKHIRLDGRKLVASNAESYDKWSQTLASAAELVNWVTKQPAEHLSHLHIYRRTGFVGMLENYASPTGLMLEGTFGFTLSSYRHPGSVSFVVNVETREETMTKFWPKLQNEVINGVYPLRRLLNGSHHSAVFLTECKAQDAPTAAIKIVPAERVTLAQLSHWRTAADLSHPHLIRLLDAGLCQLGGRQFLFVVMEYAEQTLSQVLLQRALTADEVQEMLPPALDALVFLHGKNLVQGQLKPANFLVVRDQLKLASDTVRPTGEPRASIAEPSLYDPPEAESGRLSPAGDIWALGITMVEALTRRLPASPDERSVTACLPTTLAPTFVDTLQRCLSHDPGSRPTAIDLEAQFKRAPQASVVSVPQAIVRDAPGRADPQQESPKPRALAPIIATVLILLVAVWAGLRLFQSHPNSQQPAASTVQPSSQQGASAPAAALPTPETPLSAPPEVSAPLASAKSRESKPAPVRPVSRQSDQPAQPLADASPSVVHEEIPIVPRSASETIHGHVRVAVLVIVDRSGNVIDALVENPGPSSYFARLAREAARKWRFAPADNEDSREWLLKFEFTRGGTTGRAATPPS